MAIVARVIVQSHPPRIGVTKFDELPRKGALLRLNDGSVVKVKKIKPVRPGNGADVLIYAKPA